MASKGTRLAGLLLLLAVTLAYSNHFQNGFHFDDFHTINDNPYIRSLKNAGRFFTDTSTFSIRPMYRTYRPIVSLSLAVDYWLGSGFRPFYFHLSTFLWYLGQLALMFLLFRHILRLTSPEPRTSWAALFAVALYGLHPAMADTVNYIIQRGDLYSTALVILALAIYALAPKLRRFGIYLLPLITAMLTKPPAAIFPAILFAYVFLFEERRMGKALLQCAPSLAVVGAMMWLQVRMTPATYLPGAIPYSQYLVTQLWVALHYFLMFFAPVGLTASSDQLPLQTIFCPQGIAGLMFLLGLVWAIAAASGREPLRPIAFGLAWFLLALIPTSVYRLFEIENDHRMFFPFVGLALAVSWGAALGLAKLRVRTPVLATLAIPILAACAWGTYQRNEVWRDEESLWRDVTIKSPHNGPGLTNYGRILTAKGQPGVALEYFERALPFSQHDAPLEFNLAGAYASLHMDGSAETHFVRATRLAPEDAEPNFAYGQWLNTKGRLPEAIAQFRLAILHGREYIEPRHALMQAYLDSGMRTEAQQLAAETLRIAPGDTIARAFLNGQATARPVRDYSNDGPSRGRTSLSAEAAVREMPVAENYLALSAAYYRDGRFRESIQAAEEALKLRPGYAPAYNNVAVCQLELGEWDAAIAAAEEAVRLDPDFQLAWNNLERAERLKKEAGKKK